MNTFRLVPRARWSLVIAAALTAVACGGGQDGVGLGDGQTEDPVALDFPIAYVRRPIPVDDNGDALQVDVRNVLRFNVGADLFVRDRASPSTPDTNITETITQGLGDIRDVDISNDGTKVLFAMRAQFIEGADEEDQPTWNIWEYDIPTDTLRRIITSDITAEAGHDIAPHFLPDGRIVFSSTRQRRSVAILLDEGKPQYPALDEDRNEPAFVLHRMDADGLNIEQLSFNQSHDYDPVVVADGRIVYSRWDHAGPNNAIHLYRMNPDGSAVELLYGAESHNTGSGAAEVHFLGPRELPEGGIAALLRPFAGTGEGGDVISIDTDNYINNTQPNVANIGILSGPAQTPTTVNDVLTADDEPSPGGRFSAVYPLQDGTNRIMVSWSPCRLTDGISILACTQERLADPNLVEAAPLFGIWIYDRDQNTQLPIVVPEEGFQFSEIVAAEQRTNPPLILDGGNDFALDPDLRDDGAGVIHIRSVYDFNGVDVSAAGIPTLSDPIQTTAAERPARFVRFWKPVSMPDDDILEIDGSAFGVTQAFGMREIVGYAEVEPDGSVMAKVPANVALSFQVLDADGRAISGSHNNWLQVVPGEYRECGGCHNANNGQSHGRSDAFNVVNAGATADGQPFPNTNPSIFADFGETMAEARIRVSCSTNNCAALEPSLDIIFDDVWTDPAQRAVDAPFSYRYQDLSVPLPVDTACVTNWTSLCRSVVQYEESMHPLWSLSRTAISDQAILDVAGNVIDNCTGCHTPVDAAGMAMVPASQLDLTDGVSDIDPDHFKAYRELLSGDNEQEVNANGVLVDRQVEIGLDPNGIPILELVPVAPSMQAGSANGSARFLDRFDAGGTHANYLSPAELKLVSEWLDVGAQYYNNPFEAPQD
ncbi:MAG: hypothetical protein AAGC71_18320 [Pseudomonadota bacterium]